MDNQKRTNSQKEINRQREINSKRGINSPKRMTCKKGSRAKARKRAKIKRLLKKVGILAGVGTIAIGGYKAVGSVENLFNKVSEESQENKKTKQQEWLEQSKIRTEETVKAQELPKQKDILDQILEQYNSGLPQEQQIDIEDIGIWEDQSFNDGQIYQTEDGNYIRNGFIELNEEENSIEWIDGEDIKDLITVFDKENRKTVTSVGIINGEYTPVEVDQFQYDRNSKERYTKAENYITLEGNQEENFKKLHQKVIERIQSKENEHEQADDESR